ncbi:MAG TPA: SpoIIE family protein phosphatase [Rectinemataceae bacterium]|nr:SpoIIE family protein phosphatase [Rectinemataceae bacterium]
MSQSFVEIGTYQLPKGGELAAGDVFMSRKLRDSDRSISVLSDGLGSGIKAGVLATLTATLASGCIASDMPIRKTARLIMKSLPVCSERKISYSTFTIVDIGKGTEVKIIEYDNPPYLLLREGVELEPIKLDIAVTKKENIGRHPKKPVLHWSTFKAQFGDRLIFFSDGVTQAGMGTKAMPLGWGLKGVRDFASDLIRSQTDISAREIARAIALKATYYDGGSPKDDITCATVYFRQARRLLISSGPPIHPEDDHELAAIFSAFEGKKIICGGTTANIIARELKRHIKVSLKASDPLIPPPATMEGADLITEGILTLGKVIEYLDQDARPENLDGNAAAMILQLLFDSDSIEFLVGTKINEAHQDPTMPVELEIRRYVIKRLASLLEEKYLKEVAVRFI